MNALYFKKIVLLTVTPIYLWSGLALADENLWLYAQGADTRPKDTWELKLGDLSRIDKGSGNYIYNEARPEIEYGITDRLTLGAKLIIMDHHYSVDDPELNPMFETQGGDGGEFLSSSIEVGGRRCGRRATALEIEAAAIGEDVQLDVGQADGLAQRRRRHR